MTATSQPGDQSLSKATAYTPPTGFIDLLIDAVFAVDADANVVFASASCERIFGYSPQEMVGKNMFDLMVPEDREPTRESIQAIMAGHPQLVFENRYIRKDGRIAHIMWSTRWSPTEQLRIGVARDITERKHAETMQAALYAISEAAHAAKDLPTLFKGIHQIVGTLLRADNFSVTLYDQDTDQLSYPYHIDQHEPRYKPSRPATGTLCAAIIRNKTALLLTPETMHAHAKELRASGGVTPFCWLGAPLRTHNGIIGVLILKSYPGGARYTEKDQALLQFVSTQIATAIERQQMQARLQHLAQHDQLTELPNRGLLYERLQLALSVARAERGRLAVLYIDLDKFKQVNDTLGHNIGDRLLQAVADRLRHCVRETDTVARIGGDEFVVLLHRIPAPALAERVAAGISEALGHPFIIDGHRLSIVPSIGIARYPEHGEESLQLLVYADQAMYASKNGTQG